VFSGLFAPFLDAYRRNYSEDVRPIEENDAKDNDLDQTLHQDNLQ